MDKRPAIFILVFFLVTIPTASAFGAETSRENLLWDGFVLKGVDGKLTSVVLNRKGQAKGDSDAPVAREPKRNSGKSGWFFEFAADVNDLRVKAPAGTKLKLLPSSTLEKLIADVNERSANTYRLSGWVTKYKGRNFIFPNHFLPVGTISKQQPIAAQPRRDRPAVSDPNDVLALPQEIIERLKTRRIVKPETLRRNQKAKKMELQQDTILADRSAFLVKQNDGRLIFVLDALGRNVRPVSIRLLPCEALEMAEREQ
ncbi:MAG: hypothetical protein HQ580_11480, partial [Planctomycetes bacterium]|nr:hypothetical protein [Planctomycetota bacterium]